MDPAAVLTAVEQACRDFEVRCVVAKDRNQTPRGGTDLVACVQWSNIYAAGVKCLCKPSLVPCAQRRLAVSTVAAPGHAGRSGADPAAVQEQP